MSAIVFALGLMEAAMLFWWRRGRKAAADAQERNEIEQVIEIMRTAGRDACNGFEIGVDVDQLLESGQCDCDKRDVAPVGPNQYGPDRLDGTAPPIPISRRFQAADAQAEVAQLAETHTLTEVTTLRDRVRVLEGQLEEAKQERDLARDQLAAAPQPVVELVAKPAAEVIMPTATTWHGLIERAIKMLRAMPENDRQKAMNQWSGAVTLSVVFPQRSRKEIKARPQAEGCKGRRVGAGEAYRAAALRSGPSAARRCAHPRCQYQRRISGRCGIGLIMHLLRQAPRKPADARQRQGRRQGHGGGR